MAPRRPIGWQLFRNGIVGFRLSSALFVHKCFGQLFKNFLPQVQGDGSLRVGAYYRAKSIGETGSDKFI
jgi:hypothetical protein